mgnify:CR=1 FL=1
MEKEYYTLEELSKVIENINDKDCSNCKLLKSIVDLIDGVI